MTTFTIHASRDGETIEAARTSPTMTVAKARALLNDGWQVHITDTNGRRYQPETFEQVLSFDRD
jgi:hypothetical protein